MEFEKILFASENILHNKKPYVTPIRWQSWMESQEANKVIS